MNLADSSSLVAAMTARGFRRVNRETEADLIVLNTCSVREKAEERIFGRLGEVLQFKQRRPETRIAVVGCMAQRLGAELIKKAPQVDFVLGPDQLLALPDMLAGQRPVTSVLTDLGRTDIDCIKPVRETPWAGFVTISRGCGNYCSYCIVPYVRGPERSHSVEHVLQSVQEMADQGVVEVSLLGQNVNSYSFDGVGFPDLLRRVATETDIRRIRFMTSHPKDLSRELVDVIAAQPKVMPHIHLPLQSGSDRILERMGRVYSWDHYRGIVDYIKATLDYVVLTTDIIVGFPSETPDEYEMTLDAVRYVQYDSAFMFRYSVRPGTRAASFVDDVPEEEKIDRLNRLIELQQSISLDRNQREVDQVRHCLVEGYSRRSTEYGRARSEGNKTVLYRADQPEVGKVVPLKITAADAFTLHGDLVEVA